MINYLLTLYKQRFSFDRFYDTLLYNISTYPSFHVTNKTFLSGYSPQITLSEDAPHITTSPGDIRVDLPVWFGHPDATRRIAIIGMEPRDTDKKYGRLNIERAGNYVFATPFALERKKGPYHSAFHTSFDLPNTFLYFTDVVKTYAVSDGGKKADDKAARVAFKKKAEQEKQFLLEELDMIKPSAVIALGNVASTFLSQHLEGHFSVHKVRHPSQGGALLARKQLGDLLNAMQ